MDPTATLNLMNETESTEEYEELCCDLANWLENGGFTVPAITELTGSSCPYGQADWLRNEAARVVGRG